MPACASVAPALRPWPSLPTPSSAQAYRIEHADRHNAEPHTRTRSGQASAPRLRSPGGSRQQLQAHMAALTARKRLQQQPWLAAAAAACCQPPPLPTGLRGAVASGRAGSPGRLASCSSRGGDAAAAGGRPTAAGGARAGGRRHGGGAVQPWRRRGRAQVAGGGGLHRRGHLVLCAPVPQARAEGDVRGARGRGGGGQGRQAHSRGQASSAGQRALAALPR